MIARIVLAALFCLLCVMQEGGARSFTDAAGRTVEVPDAIRRVMAAGPPASVLLYTLAPDKMVGWVRAPRPAERPYIAAAYRDLPEHGRLTGRGSTASIETVLSLRPDVIVDVGTVDDTYASLADRVQRQTGIPYLLIDGSVARTAQTYREIGALLGVERRAAELAAYAERALSEARRLSAGARMRPRVYYGRGTNGLETGLAGSINVEVLETVGGFNVASAAGSGGLTSVSMEQVLSWNPDIVLVANRRVFESVTKSPLWQSVAAVRTGRVYRAPELPWGWFDSPPSVNRLIGLDWLATVLYRRDGAGSLGARTREFYRLFYRVDLTDAQVSELLADAVPRHQ